MIDYSGLIPIIGGLIGRSTAPDMPNIAPYDPDLIERIDLNSIAPQLEGLMDQQGDIASSLMKGELPADVQSQIRMMAGQAAQRSGTFASTGRTGNVTMRDIGLNSLDAMAMGQQYSNFLYSYASQERQSEYTRQTANANMLYDAWASRASQQMGEYAAEVNQNNQMWGGVVSGASQLAGSYYDNKAQDAARIQAANAITSGQNFQREQTQMLIDAMYPSQSSGYSGSGPTSVIAAPQQSAKDRTGAGNKANPNLQIGLNGYQA